MVKDILVIDWTETGWVRATASHPVRVSRLRLVASAEAPGLARQAVGELLGADDSASLAFSLRLVASELVKNAVLNGSEQEPIRVDLKIFRDWAELRVQNRGNRIRIGNLRARSGDGGRGLEIIDALADAWSVDTGPAGTTFTV